MYEMSNRMQRNIFFFNFQNYSLKNYLAQIILDCFTHYFDMDSCLIV